MSVSPVTVTSVVLLLCLLWMDTCLYFQIQSINDTQLMKTANSTVSTSDVDDEMKKNRYSLLMNKFSFAFQGMSVKLMMTDPVDNYLLSPLSEAFAGMVNFKDNFPFISANVVSYAGVISALVAGKLVSHDSSTMHKLSVVMFQLRTWLDDLDGAVARSRLGIHKHVSLQKTPGYVIDGVCDAIGFIAYIVGCYVFLKNTIRRRSRTKPANRYNLQSITEVKSTNGSSDSTYIPLQQDVCNENDCANHSELHHQADSDGGFNSVDDEEEDDEVVHFNTDDDLEVFYSQKHHQSDSKQSKSGHPSRWNDFTMLPRGSVRASTRGLARTKIYLEKIQNGKQSSVIFYRYIKEKIKNNLSNRKLVLVTLCFLLQIAMCATFWNRYILVYRDLLESPSDDQTQARNKVKILKSNITYLIIWFWRLTNGHSFMQMLIASVFLGKLWEFLDFIKYIGFIEIILLATVTELHIIDVRNYLS